ncbi:hypothetical protein BYT27DRAFT_6553252 [Phlegmacium glaucopus]|nr:hypothetical protein BYT27DRAFT_6553252 [Phlegmacium glaucopus]
MDPTSSNGLSSLPIFGMYSLTYVIFHLSLCASSCSSPSPLSSCSDVWPNAYREQARTNPINDHSVQRRLHLHQSGILLDNSSFLAWYTFLTWITFAFLVTPGYVTHKRLTFNLEGKINSQWSRTLDTSDRLRIQNELPCCGYFSPFVEATISQTCHARSILPGCKGPYLGFERKLGIWIKAVFSLVPVQVLVLVAGLLCSNHITYRFGKGMMPEAYQLDIHTMAVIMDNYANQLA